MVRAASRVGDNSSRPQHLSTLWMEAVDFSTAIPQLSTATHDISVEISPFTLSAHALSDAISPPTLSHAWSTVV